jgi:uncharacterized RDD family membrane protein YckC
VGGGDGIDRSEIRRIAMTELNGDATKSRLLAAFVDNFLAIILCLLIASKLPGDLSSGIRWTLAIASYLAYFLVQEAIWQATLGKRLFGLVVVRRKDLDVR